MAGRSDGRGLDITVLIEGPGKTPVYATEGAAGADLFAFLDAPLVIAPGHRSLVPTGIHIAIPEGFEGQVRPRSGLALRHGLEAHLGTIDADYRGEIRVLVFNLGEEDVAISPGERIAQIVFAPVARARFRAGELGATTRGQGGFGHTGR